MYVCLCNGYRDAEIRAVAASGVRCVRRAYLVLGAEPRCGRCLPLAQALIDGIHGDERLDTPEPARLAHRAEGEVLGACIAGDT